jgi:type IV fimbrial biogenesis protein FimT
VFLSRFRQRAFTLIEILVSMTIGAILLFMAAPSYTQWVSEAQTRAAAESLASGLRMTMAEAVKRNTSVEFVLDPTTKTGGWIVQPPTPPGGAIYGSAGFAEGAPLSTLTVTPGGLTKVTFTGLGTVAPANADATLPFDRVDVATAAGGRSLRVLVGGTRTGIKICDPLWPVTDPKGCPNPGG